MALQKLQAKSVHPCVSSCGMSYSAEQVCFVSCITLPIFRRYILIYLPLAQWIAASTLHIKSPLDMKDNTTTKYIQAASMPPVPQGAKAKITLNGAPKTLLVTLYCRSYDCQNGRPALNDRWAGYVLQHIDFDFEDSNLTPFFCNSMALRARYFDQWTTDFLERHTHQPVTVLHLACGLNAQAHRVRWFNDTRGRVRWIDVDLPEVVDLRRKLLPEPQGDYQL